MSNHFKRRLYTLQDIKRVDGHLRYVTNEDGTLFSGPYRTKIKPEDLPEWYLHGRYYKRWGYMSAKGITDLLYIPSRFSNHYLKDDCLLIAYGGKITENTNPERDFFLEKYDGWDERVWGSEIVTMLRGARKYSGYNIAPFIEKLKWKKEYMHTEFPDEFGPDRWDIDVDLIMIDPMECPECHKHLKLMRSTETADGGCDVVGHCPWCLQDWQWHCDKQGWETDMRRYFHG